jgi:hypothetical protein
MEVVWTEKNELVVNEHDVSTIEWQKPVDEENIYDPTIELELWQFTKLGLNDQIDYLLNAAVNILGELDFESIEKRYPRPCSVEDVILRLDAKSIQPRIDIGERLRTASAAAREQLAEAKELAEATNTDPETIYGPGHRTSKGMVRRLRSGNNKDELIQVAHPGANRNGWFNYDKYNYVYLNFKTGDRWHTTMAYSPNHRTTFVWLLLQFVIQYKPHKYSHLKNALEYYETSKALVNKPRKFQVV